jgi:hypothetical protein
MFLIDHLVAAHKHVGEHVSPHPFGPFDVLDECIAQYLFSRCYCKNLAGWFTSRLLGLWLPGCVQNNVQAHMTPVASEKLNFLPGYKQRMRQLSSAVGS